LHCFQISPDSLTTDSIVQLPADLDKRVVLAWIGSEHFAPVFNRFAKLLCPLCRVKAGSESRKHFVEFA
jgi:hypothetical protein